MLIFSALGGIPKNSFKCGVFMPTIRSIPRPSSTLNPQKIVTTDPKGDGNRRRDEKKRKKSLFFKKGLDFFAKV